MLVILQTLISAKKCRIDDKATVTKSLSSSSLSVSSNNPSTVSRIKKSGSSANLMKRPVGGTVAVASRTVHTVKPPRNARPQVGALPNTVAKPSKSHFV